jgi:uncharacterized membrane protein YeaQ/YmgE (transglycosylase-associated protein family)
LDKKEIIMSLTMSFIAWIAIGLIAGVIATKLVKQTSEGLPQDIGLGIVGALAGGWLFSSFGILVPTGINFYALFAAVIGASVLLFAYHAFRGTRVAHS